MRPQIPQLRYHTRPRSSTARISCTLLLIFKASCFQEFLECKCEKTTCNSGRVGDVDQKRRKNLALVESYVISPRFYTWNPDPTPGSPPWCLRLQSRTFPNSSGSRGCWSPKLSPGPALCSAPERQERSKTCSTTPARWQHPWKRRHNRFLWRSWAPQCMSRSGQLPTPGHPIIPKTGCTSIGMIWWSFLILFQSLHVFTSVRPAS